MKVVFSYTINQFRSIRTGEFIIPDEGLVSFLRRINTQSSLEILTPSQNGSTIFWKSKNCEYKSFNNLEEVKKIEMIQIFNGFRQQVIEHSEKVLHQEFSSLELKQNAVNFSKLLKKTVDFQNIKLVYCEEKDRTGLIFGFVFSDLDVINYSKQFLILDESEANNAQEIYHVTEPIVETNPTVHSIEDESPITPRPVRVRRQRHPWWINTIRCINWFAWRYWWLVWLIFLLSLLLLYLFCPCKKNLQKQACDQLHHIHKNIDTLNSGLLFCCDCNRKLLPENPEPEPDTTTNPEKKSPKPPKKPLYCNSFVQSGSDGIDIQYVNLGSKSGRVIITYDMVDEPDKLEVFYEGKRVTSTFEVGGNSKGFVGGANSAGATGTLIFNYNHNVEDFVKVVLTGGKGTSWNYKISCPN